MRGASLARDQMRLRSDAPTGITDGHELFRRGDQPRPGAVLRGRSGLRCRASRGDPRGLATLSPWAGPVLGSVTRRGGDREDPSSGKPDDAGNAYERSDRGKKTEPRSDHGWALLLPKRAESSSRGICVRESPEVRGHREREARQHEAPDRHRPRASQNEASRERPEDKQPYELRSALKRHDSEFRR